MKRSLVAFFLAAGLLGHGALSLSAFAQDGPAPAAVDCPFQSSPAGVALEATLPTTPDDEVKSFKELLELRAAWADEAANRPDAAPAPAAAIDDAPLADAPAAADVAPVMEAAAEAAPAEFDFGVTAEPPAPTEEPAEELAGDAANAAGLVPVAVEPAAVEPAMAAPLASELPIQALESIEEMVSEAPPEPTDEEPAVEAAPVVEESIVADEVAPEAMEALVEAAAPESPRLSAGRKIAARISDFGRNTLIGFGEFLAVFHPGNWFVDDLNEDAALDIAESAQPIDGEFVLDEMPAAPEAAIEADLAIEADVAIEEAPLAEIEPAVEADVAMDAAPLGQPGVDFDEAIVSEGVVIVAPEAARAAAIDDLAIESRLDLSIEATIVGVTSEAIGSHVVSRQDPPAVADVLTDEAILATEPAASEPAPVMAAEAPAVLEEAGPSLALEAAPVEADVAIEAAPAVAPEAAMEVAAEPAPALNAEVAAEALPVIEGAANPFDGAAARTLEEMFDEDAPPAPESINEPEVLEEVGPAIEAPEASLKLLEIQSLEFEELKRGIEE